MPIMMTSRRKSISCSSSGGSSSNSCDTVRVKVKDSRRKQQWVDPLPTPPRSPSSFDLFKSEEPIMDDLWELWTGTGLIDDLEEVDQKFTLDSALSGLGFTDEEQRHSSCSGTYRRVSIGDIDAEGLFNNISSSYDDSDLMTEGEDEELLKHLFQFVSDDSPPPTNPPSPPAPGEIELDALDVTDGTALVINGIKRESYSSRSSVNGDSDDSSQLDEGVSSDSGIENGESPFYDEGLIGEDLINSQPDLFGDNPFDLLDTTKLNSIFEADLRHAEDELQQIELKHDCMWNGICCPSKTGIKHEHSPTDSSPKFENQTNVFLRTKIKIEPIDIPVNIKPEPEVELEADLGDEDEAMCWSNDPYQMWTEETPPPSQDPTAPCEVDESDSFRDLDWREAIDDSKEHMELEMRRNATKNDHSYANPFYNEFKATVKGDTLRKGIQGIVLKHENDDDHSGGPKKTKILVPLKDLMDSLQHKTFLVAPLGPGKKVIRLTGSETVKGMLGVHHAAFNSSLKSYCVPQTSLFNRSVNHGSSRTSTSTTTLHTSINPTSSHSRHKKSKANRSIMREGGTITFPNQVPSPSSPASPSSSSSPSSSTSLTASGRPKKTKTHNNMERMRRIDLRNSFDSLKKLVPPLAKSSKCSKVEILRRAEEYIRALKSVEKRLLREEATVRSRNEALKLKLLHSQQ